MENLWFSIADLQRRKRLRWRTICDSNLAGQTAPRAKGSAVAQQEDHENSPTSRLRRWLEATPTERIATAFELAELTLRVLGFGDLADVLQAVAIILRLVGKPAVRAVVVATWRLALVAYQRLRDGMRWVGSWAVRWPRKR